MAMRSVENIISYLFIWNHTRRTKDQIILGLLCIGTHSAIMTMAPLRMPDVPIPATTLPPISMFEEVETAHIMEPSSKMAKKLRNVH